MSFINIFRKMQIVVGDLYISKSATQDPWNDHIGIVEVLEKKEGWVRYRFTEVSNILQNETMKESIFRDIFSRYCQMNDDIVKQP